MAIERHFWWIIKKYIRKSGKFVRNHLLHGLLTGWLPHFGMQNCCCLVNPEAPMILVGIYQPARFQLVDSF